jgi:hypothetical protein
MTTRLPSISETSNAPDEEFDDTIVQMDDDDVHVDVDDVSVDDAAQARADQLVRDAAAAQAAAVAHLAHLTAQAQAEAAAAATAVGDLAAAEAGAAPATMNPTTGTISKRRSTRTHVGFREDVTNDLINDTIGNDKMLDDLLEEMGYETGDMTEMMDNYTQSTGSMANNLQQAILDCYRQILFLHHLLEDKDITNEIESEDEWHRLAKAAQNTCDCLIRLKSIQHVKQNDNYMLDKNDYDGYHKSCLNCVDICMKNFRKISSKRARDQRAQDAALNPVAPAVPPITPITANPATGLATLPPLPVMMNNPPPAGMQDPSIIANLYKMLSDLQIKITTMEAAAKAPPPPETSARSLLGTSRPSLGKKIKPIKLTDFGGEKLQYNTFRQTFKSIYESENMKPIELAIRLFEHLVGDARSKVFLLFNYDLDDYTYEKMWKELELYYGGDYEWQASISKRIKEVRPLKSDAGSVVEPFYKCVDEVYRYYFKNGPFSIHDSTNFMYTELRRKLSHEVGVRYRTFCALKGLPDSLNSMYIWARHIWEECIRSGKENATETPQHDNSKRNLKRGKVSNVGMVTNDEGLYSDDDDIDYDESDNESCYTEPDYDEEEDVESTTAMAVAIVRAIQQTWRPRVPAKKQYDCKDCASKSHTLIDCPKFQELTCRDKHTHIRSLNFCFHCLRGEHRVRECKWKEGVKCDISGCKLYHHRSIHYDRPKVSGSNPRKRLK